MQKDTLTLSGDTIVVKTAEGGKMTRDAALLEQMLRQDAHPPIGGAALPDGVKFLVWRPPVLVVVRETPAHVRSLRWIKEDSPAPYGKEATYRRVRLSIPYSVMFATYTMVNGALQLTANNELYFRNKPLHSKLDQLGYAALLNVSRIKSETRSRAWICTQFLNRSGSVPWTKQLDALWEHLWNGGFNLSSEHHEGASWYGESAGIHPELHPVESWEAASKKDNAFALSVEWLPVPHTVGELMELMAQESRPKDLGPAPSLIGRFMTYAQAYEDPTAHAAKRARKKAAV